MRYVFRKAFTMLELVIVIVVIGILAMAAIPRVKDDQLAELVDQTVSLIRYTQHLAMQNNPFDPQDPAWFKKRWTIQFVQCTSKNGVFGANSGSPFGFTVFRLTDNSGGPIRLNLPRTLSTLTNSYIAVLDTIARLSFATLICGIKHIAFLIEGLRLLTLTDFSLRG